MPSLQDLNVIGFIFSAWCFHITRQTIARLIGGSKVNVFDIKEGVGLEPLEFKFSLKFLLSKKLRVWYLLNRLAAILAINFFFWAMRWLILKWTHS